MCFLDSGAGDSSLILIWGGAKGCGEHLIRDTTGTIAAVCVSQQKHRHSGGHGSGAFRATGFLSGLCGRRAEVKVHRRAATQTADDHSSASLSGELSLSDSAAFTHARSTFPPPPPTPADRVSLCVVMVTENFLVPLQNQLDASAN